MPLFAQIIFDSAYTTNTPFCISDIVGSVVVYVMPCQRSAQQKRHSFLDTSIDKMVKLDMPYLRGVMGNQILLM